MGRIAACAQCAPCVQRGAAEWEAAPLWHNLYVAAGAFNRLPKPFTSKWHLVPGGDLDLRAWMEGALGTISISAVRLLVGSTCGVGGEPAPELSPA